MREYEFSLTRILPYNDKIYESVNIMENTSQIPSLYARIRVGENPYSRIFYAV